MMMVVLRSRRVDGHIIVVVIVLSRSLVESIRRVLTGSAGLAISVAVSTVNHSIVVAGGRRDVVVVIVCG